MLLGLLRPADPGVGPAQSSIYISTCADVRIEYAFIRWEGEH